MKFKELERRSPTFFKNKSVNFKIRKYNFYKNVFQKRKHTKNIKVKIFNNTIYMYNN